MSAARTFKSTPFGTPGISTQSLGIPAAAYPGRLATNSDLIVAVDRQQTSLLVALTAASTSMTVLDPSMIVQYSLLSIDNEIVKITGVPAGNVVPILRGFDGTVPASHQSGAFVLGLVDAYHHNALVAEIEAIETALGPNLTNIAGSQQVQYNAAYIFSPQAPGGVLSPGNNVVTLSPVPKGVNGTDTNHYLYISGGTGAAEAVLITGGTAVAGSPSGTVIVNCANGHSGAWTIQTATGGIQEALVALLNNPALAATVVVNQGATIYATIYLYRLNANLGQSIIGVRGVVLTAAANFIGSRMLKGDDNVASCLLSDIIFNANNVAAITTIIDLSRTESSIRNTIQRIVVMNAVNNATMINLDGSEDSDILDCQLINAGGAGAIAVQWHVAGGNIRISGLTTFWPVLIAAQVATIDSSTMSGIVTDGIVQSLAVTGGYIYPHPVNLAHFSTGPSGGFNVGTVTGCYLVPATGVNNLPVFKGIYNGTFFVTGTTIDPAGQTGYTFVSSATIAAGAGAYFYLAGNLTAAGSSIGIPGPGCYVFSQNFGVVYSAQTVAHGTSSIASTDLLPVIESGVYRIDYNLSAGNVNGTATVAVGFSWQDNDAVRTLTSQPLALAAGAVASTGILAVPVSGHIIYFTTYTPGTGGNYDLWVTITKVG